MGWRITCRTVGIQSKRKRGVSVEVVSLKERLKKDKRWKRRRKKSDLVAKEGRLRVRCTFVEGGGGRENCRLLRSRSVINLYLTGILSSNGNLSEQELFVCA